MRFLLIVGGMIFLSVAFAAKEGETQYTQTELILSQHYRLTPAEIREVETIRAEGRFDGFVDLDNLTIYEVLALQTDDEARLRRLARLYLKMDRAIIAKLQRFSVIYTQEAKR